MSLIMLLIALYLSAVIIFREIFLTSINWRESCYKCELCGYKSKLSKIQKATLLAVIWPIVIIPFMSWKAIRRITK